jgi:hypothetical protein
VVITDSALIGDGLSFTLPNGCAIVGINGANIEKRVPTTLKNTA